jgi:hypothetical protein
MIDSNIKSKLERIKQLLDSKSISESEYDVLKEEILFNMDTNNKNLKKENKSTISNNIINNEKYHVDNEQNSKEKNTFVYIIIGFFIIGLWFWNSKNNSSDNNSNTVDETLNTISTTDENISETSSTVCKICSREFTGDGYDKIDGQWQRNKDMQTELCSASCAREQSEKMDKTYDDILEKHGYQKVFTEKCSRCSGDFEEGFCERCGAASAEKVDETYSNMPNCEMCSGTGITDGYDGKRICSVCNGKGKQTY